MERNIESPLLAGKGAIGSLSRSSIEEPLERSVPPGSTKIISMHPLVESGIPEAATGVGLSPAIRSAIPQRSQSQPLFQGSTISPSTPSTSHSVPGKAATYQSSPGGVAEVAQAYKPHYVSSPSPRVQGVQTQALSSTQFIRQ